MDISDNFIQELKLRNDIADIASGYMSLKQKGRNMVGLCPFHSEKTASFYLYPGNGSFYCFGCGAGGDVITFIRLAERFDYIEAIRFLAQRAGMEMPKENENDNSHRLKILIYEINRVSAAFYHNTLYSSEGENALKYLLLRGLEKNTIKHFGLGYSPPLGYALLKHLREKGYKENDIISANLAFEGRMSGRPVDRFRARVMFPIIDHRGNVVAFGGRILDDSKPKYLNTSDTLAFKKSENLFALNFAKSHTEGKIILSEGYMDVIALHQAGLQNTVATLGTALTDGQAKLIARYTNEVVICYDSDEAGRKASDRAIEILRKNCIPARVIAVPKGKDPDEYIRSYGKEGSVRFKALVENSKSDIEYRLERIKLGYNLNKSDHKVKYLTEAAKVLSQLPNPIEREVYAGKIGSESGVETGTVLLQVERYRKSRYKKEKESNFKEVRRMISAIGDKINPDKHKNLRASSAEEALISYIINNQDSAERIFSLLDEEKFLTQFNKRIYHKLKDLHECGRIFDITNITSKEFSIEETGRITKLICSYIPPLEPKKALEEYMSVINQENEKARLNSIEDEDQINKYISGLKDLKK